MTGRRTTTRPATRKLKASDGDVLSRLVGIVEKLADRLEAAERRLAALDGGNRDGGK